MGQQVDLIVTGSCNALLTVCVIAVFFVLFKSGQFIRLPLAVKLSLLGYAIFTLLLDASNVYLLAPGNIYSTAIKTNVFRDGYEACIIV